MPLLTLLRKKTFGVELPDTPVNHGYAEGSIALAGAADCTIALAGSAIGSEALAGTITVTLSLTGEDE